MTVCVCSIGIAYLSLFTLQPLQSPIIIKTPKPSVDSARFTDTISQGDFGESYTALLMMADGWIKVTSKVHGSKGIDGIFAKNFDGTTKVIIAETKTESGKLEGDQMTRSWISKKLEELRSELYVCGFSDSHHYQDACDIAKAYGNRSSHISAELWHHDFESGMTVRWLLNDSAGKAQIMPLPTAIAASKTLMASFFVSFDEFDRGGAYIHRLVQCPISAK